MLWLRRRDPPSRRFRVRSPHIWRSTALREIAEVQRDCLSAAGTRRGDIWRSTALMEVAEVQRD